MLTQISVPVIAQHFVRQPRLARKIRRHVNARLVLIVAPPGYGKTAFASSLINTNASRGTRCAWVSLNRKDDNSKQFWQLTCAALDAGGSIKLTDTTKSSDPYDIIASIVNQISARSHVRHMIAYDNYHFISNPAINDQLSTLIENAPKNLTVVLASDRMPSFPIAPLSLGDDVVEIYRDDLRFQLEETEYFLNESLQLNLSPQEIKNIHRVTRGWPAGLQMARMAYALDMSESEIVAYIENKRSAFFVDAVVSRKSDEMQRFLLRVSHLPRISPILAEHVTEMPQSGALLTELERDELFEEILHDSPPWYAFSKTFRDTLHQRALQTLSPTEICALHRRAGEWFEENGEPILAIEFALKAHEPERIANIIARNMMDVAAQSQGELLATILQRINLDGLLDAGSIGCITAWAYCTAGKPRQALHWIALARSASSENSTEIDPLFIDATEARALSLLGKFSEAIVKAQRTLEAINNGGKAVSIPWLYLTVRHTLGESYAHVGEFQESIEHLSYCTDMALPSGRIVVHYLAACELSETKALLGSWSEAKRLARIALNTPRQRLVEAPWSLALVQIQLATLLLYEGSLDEADDMARRARRRLAHQSNDDGRLCLLLFEAQLAIARGRHVEAEQALRQVLDFASKRIIPRGKRVVAVATSITHLLLMGGYPHTLDVLELIQSEYDASDPCAAALVETAHAAFSLFNNNPEAALMNLEKALEVCDTNGFLVPSASALIMQALAQAALKDVRSSTASLLDAATLLAPHGITFPVIAAGNRIGALIEQTLTQCAGASYAFQRERADEIAFLRRCASLMSDKDDNVSTLSDSTLTPREQQVYRLLQLGKSRREIADELGIAYNTVRVHVSNIYKKTQGSNGGTE